MGRLARSLIGLVLGYALGAGIGAALVSLASTNTHDKSVETVMTAFFFAGPIGAVIGLVAGLVLGASSGAVSR